MTSTPVKSASVSRTRVTTGAVLLFLGFIAHLAAAHLNGGSGIAYQHHVLGFFAILAVTGVAIQLIARFLWRGRTDVTVLTIGAVQFLMGVVVVYLELRSV